MYGGIEVQLNALLILALGGRQWSVSQPSLLYSQGEPQYILDKRLSGAQHQCGCDSKSLPLLETDPPPPLSTSP